MGSTLVSRATGEAFDERSSTRIVEIIFLPFHPIFRLVVVATAILKVYLVSLDLSFIISV